MTRRVWEAKLTTILSLCFLSLLIPTSATCLQPKEVLDGEPAYIGIELGSMHVRVASFRSGKIDILPPERASHFSPPYIAFNEEGVLFGEAARLQSESGSRNSVFGIRELIGRNFSDIEAKINQLPFKVISRANRPVIDIDLPSGNKQFSPEELYSFILKQIKTTAEEYFGAEISVAVATVPASFSEKQRDATKSAARMAGLGVRRLIKEPTAAWIAHDTGDDYDEKNYLIVGLDDNKLSIHIAEADSGLLEILASIDAVTSPGDDHYSETRSFQDGSKTDEHEPSGAPNLNAGDSLMATLPTVDLFRNSLPSMEHALKTSNLTKEDIHDFILAGNSSHIPTLQILLEEYLGTKASYAVEPASSHVIGATKHAQVLYRQEAIDHADSVLHICPFIVGIATNAGDLSPIIYPYSCFPTRQSKFFTTAAENQTTALIKVYLGARVLVRDSVLLGKFELNLPPSPRGAPVIEVAIEIDADFSLRVSARDRKSGVEELLVIQAGEILGNSRMVDFLLEQAEIFYKEDNALRRLIQSTNVVDGSRAMSS
ncbi:heat shock protein 70 family [Mariannaea sp. PMI_226]|nr:heat shock protein 70 family [Mariannaea sp. PMI_226]